MLGSLDADSEPVPTLALVQSLAPQAKPGTRLERSSTRMTGWVAVNSRKTGDIWTSTGAGACCCSTCSHLTKLLLLDMGPAVYVAGNLDAVPFGVADETLVHTPTGQTGKLWDDAETKQVLC